LRQRGALEALGDVAAQPGRVLDRLEEEGVLLMRFFWFCLFWWPGRGKERGRKEGEERGQKSLRKKDEEEERTRTRTKK